MKTAVISLCIGGEYGALARVTHPTQQRYADKIGATFHVIAEPLIPAYVKTTCTLCYEKFQLGFFLKDYDRVIYLDADVIVRSTCPDLFKIVPYGWFGAFSEGAWWERKSALEIAKGQFGVDAVHWDQKYFNAGVMVFDLTHREVFRLPTVGHNNFYDQTWFNLQVCSQFSDRFVDIGPHFNRMCSMRWEERFESHVIHYAGMGRDPHSVLLDINKWEK